MMRRPVAATPEKYVAALNGWRRECVTLLRRAVRSESRLEEVIKWGHLVYFFEGPVLLIRAEEKRVLFGFWRGKRLVELEPRLKPGGRYELATMELREGDSIEEGAARRLTKEACALNARLADPRRAAKPVTKAKRGAKPTAKATRGATRPAKPAATRKRGARPSPKTKRRA